MESFQIGHRFEEKSLSLKELATLFLRSEAMCVTFPNIKILLTIAMVLPVSTATVERSFSYEADQRSTS